MYVQSVEESLEKLTPVWPIPMNEWDSFSDEYIVKRGHPAFPKKVKDVYMEIICDENRYPSAEDIANEIDWDNEMVINDYWKERGLTGKEIAELSLLYSNEAIMSESDIVFIIELMGLIIVGYIYEDKLNVSKFKVGTILMFPKLQRRSSYELALYKERVKRLLN